MSQLKASLSGGENASPQPDNRKLHEKDRSAQRQQRKPLKCEMPCSLTIEVNMGDASPSLGLWPAHRLFIS